MKNTLCKIIIIATWLPAFVGCDREPQAFDMPECRLNFVYAGDPRLYASARKTSYSFKYSGDEVKIDTLWFEVATMGNLSETEDRPIALVQIPAENEDMENASPGVHYVAFDDAGLQRFYRIPKGQNCAEIPVVLLRDPSLADTTVVLQFGIRDNGIFKPGYEGLIYRLINITDRLAEPENWRDNISLTYGKRKHELMIEWTKKPWDKEYIDEFAASDRAYQDYVYKWLTNKLAEENEKLRKEGKGPLSEADGTEIEFL